MKANHHPDQALKVRRSTEIEPNSRHSFWQQRERIVRESSSIIADEGHDPCTVCVFGKPVVSAMPKVAKVRAMNVSKRCLDKSRLNIDRRWLQ
jgi:hypothetical protein